MNAVVPPNAAQLFDVAVYNAQVPKEGPKVCPVSCDFSVNSAYDLNLLLTQSQQYMSQVQGAFIDNSTNDQQVNIFVDVVNITYKIEPNSQAYLPMLVPKNATISMIDPSGESTAVVNFAFYNVPMPAAFWPNITPLS
jgi:hypothetical protein